MAIATILTCAESSQCEQLTSSASIHQAVEVFPGSTICVVHQFYNTFGLHLQKETAQDKNMNEETYILNAVCMSFILHDGVGRKVENPAQGVSDACSGCLIARSFVPDGNDVLLEIWSRVRLQCLEISGTTLWVHTWKRTDTTAPQISSPTINCSPSIAKIRFSQHRDARPFLKRMIHFPPILLASSWTKEGYKKTDVNYVPKHLSK